MFAERGRAVHPVCCVVERQNLGCSKGPRLGHIGGTGRPTRAWLTKLSLCTEWMHSFQEVNARAVKQEVNCTSAMNRCPWSKSVSHPFTNYWFCGCTWNSLKLPASMAMCRHYLATVNENITWVLPRGFTGLPEHRPTSPAHLPAHLHPAPGRRRTLVQLTHPGSSPLCSENLSLART